MTPAHRPADARTHARSSQHARTHARTHTHTHTHTHARTHARTHATYRVLRLKCTEYFVVTSGLHNTCASSVAGVNLDLRTVTDTPPSLFQVIYPSRSSDDRFRTVHRPNDGCASSHNGSFVTCARVQTPTSHVDISTCPLRDIGPPRLRSRAVDTNRPTAQPCAGGARLGEPVRSRRWRSGLVRPSDPARGCRDWPAGPAANLRREAGYASQRH